MVGVKQPFYKLIDFIFKQKRWFNVHIVTMLHGLMKRPEYINFYRSVCKIPRIFERVGP